MRLAGSVRRRGAASYTPTAAAGLRTRVLPERDGGGVGACRAPVPLHQGAARARRPWLQI